MITITDIQSELHEISSRVNKLSIELSELIKYESNTKIVDYEQLLLISEKHQLKPYKLNHCDSTVKKQYIRFLMTMIFLMKKNQENAWLLVCRIACGIGISEDFKSLAVDAATLSEKQINGFINTITKNNLANNFVLDCMMVYLSCNEINKKLLNYMSTWFSILKCDSNTINQLISLAKVIASNNEKEYSRLMNKPTFDIPKKIYSHYAVELKRQYKKSTKK